MPGNDEYGRSKPWPSEEKGNAIKGLSEVFPPDGDPGAGNLQVKADQLKMVVDWLLTWAEDVETWDRRVKEDILRIEGWCHMPPGNPGDPPPPPPRK